MFPLLCYIHILYNISNVIKGMNKNVQGKRIINVFSIKLASGHGFLVQNRAIMRYTLIVAK